MQNDCVTETKVTLFRSNTSTSLAKSVSERRQPVDLVADDGVDPAGLDISDQPLQRRALQRAAAVPAIVVAVVEGEPAFMALAVDVGSAGLALGVEAVEGQLQALLAGLSACRSRSGPCA